MAFEHAGDDGNAREPEEPLETERQHNQPGAWDGSASGERSPADISEHGE